MNLEVPFANFIAEGVCSDWSGNTWNVCIVCGVRHSLLLPCPCVQCHQQHFGLDCPDALGDIGGCVSNWSGLKDRVCISCSMHHPPSQPCPCIRCHARHSGSECQSISHEIGIVSDWSGMSSKVCIVCSCQHLPSSSCPCIRCHARHPGFECPSPCREYSRFKVTSSVRVLASTALPKVDDVLTYHCGSMNVQCPHCKARSFPRESLNCCAKGNVFIPDLNTVPSALSDIILSPHVRSNFRIYNSVLALASVGHDNQSLVGGTFVLGGKAYHRIGSIVPSKLFAA